MKPILCFLFVIATLALHTHVSAQKLWSLEECIRYAWENNIQLKKQDLQTQYSKTNYEQSKVALLPDLNVGGNHAWNFGRKIDPYTNEFSNTTVTTDNLYAQSTLVLFNGFQLINSVRQNEILLEKSFQDYEKAKNDIGIQIATVYLQILFNEENLNVALKQQEISQLQREKMGKLVEVGNKSKGDLLLMQAQEANDKYNSINAKNNLSISYLTLAQLLELKTSEDFKIKIPDSLTIDNTNVLLSVEEIYKVAETKLPQIKSAQYDLMSSEKNLSIAKGSLSPQLSLTGSYSTGFSDARQKITGANPTMDTIGYVSGIKTMPVTSGGVNLVMGKYSFMDQLKDNANKTLSINLNIPLFTRFQTRSKISNARIKLHDSEYSLELTRKSLYKEIQTAHADAVAALEKFYAATEAVRSNEEAFKYSQQKFDVGMLSAVDFNTAKNNLTKANSDLIQAKYQYVFKLKILDFYKGLPLVL